MTRVDSAWPSYGLWYTASVMLLVLSLFGFDPASAQVRHQGSPAWVLSVNKGHLTAHLHGMSLRIVLEELARQVPLRLSVPPGWHDHPVSAEFRALPLDEGIKRLLAGHPYAIIYAPRLSRVGSGGHSQMVELVVLEARHTTASAGSSETPASTTELGSGAALTPEWAAALAHPDPKTRLKALDQLTQQSDSTVDALTLAISDDPDESVRAKALELIQGVWAAMVIPDTPLEESPPPQ